MNIDCTETKELISAFYNIYQDCLQYKSRQTDKYPNKKTNTHINCNVYLSELNKVILKHMECDPN